MQRSLFMRLYRLRWRPVAFLPGINRTTESGRFSRGIFAVFTLAIFSLAFSLPAQAGQQVLKGHVPPMAKKLTPLQRLDGGAQMNLAIGLPLRNREQLTNLLHDLYQPGGANFRHYLSPEDFASKFGPSEEDYQAVMDFAKSHGLTVKKMHPNRTLLDVSGSVADIEKAFHIHMNVFQHPTEKRIFFAPDAEPTPDLATPLLAISGLDNYVKPRPHIHPWRAPTGPMVRPFGGGGSGGGGSNTGPFEGHDFRNAYAAGLTQTGINQSIGIFELFGFSQQDILDYENDAGIIPVNVVAVLIDGATGDDVNVDYTNQGYIGYGLEAASDIEMAISMAPEVDSILVYIGPTPLDQAPLAVNFVQDATTTAQINDVLNRMATDDAANQLSCSYGMDINLSTVQIFQQFAAQGQSFFQASGDLGAYPGAIDEPADDPYVTVVGGTTLTTTASGAWASDVVWLTPADQLGDPFMASGGGVSLTYPIPSWQQGISMTANQGSTTMRNLPDVAMVANNVTIFWGNDAAGTSLALQEAGTSLAAPLWAGFMAMVNQQAADDFLPPVGFINPTLYAIGKSAAYTACFHDVTSGNNFSSNSPSKYAATPGYDLCSGWGTMIGSNLMTALLFPQLPNLVIGPPGGFTSFGPSGGPFTVSSQTYVVINADPVNPLNWGLANTPPWLNVSSGGGTLAPSGSTNVTVSLNSAASNSMIASFSGNVLFWDLTDGTFENRQFDLHVGNGDFETGDFTDWVFNGDPTLTFPLAGDDVDVGGTQALPGSPDELFVHAGLYGAYLGEFLFTNNGVVSPAIGSLSQTVATTVGKKYLVSFWLTGVLPDGSSPTNSFVAKWNGSTLFSGTDMETSGWTNMQFIVPVTTASATLEFDFNNVPGAFGLDDVTVEPVPAPVFQSATLAGGSIKLTWGSVPNGSYQVQSASNPAGPTWTNVGGPIIASGNVTSASEPIGAAAQQFYRVVLLLGP